MCQECQDDLFAFVATKRMISDSPFIVYAVESGRSHSLMRVSKVPELFLLSKKKSSIKFVRRLSSFSESHLLSRILCFAYSHSHLVLLYSC